MKPGVRVRMNETNQIEVSELLPARRSARKGLIAENAKETASALSGGRNSFQSFTPVEASRRQFDESLKMDRHDRKV